jgi:hypothetical protein
VAAHDEVERDLALADARLPEQQDADAEHVEQHAVHRRLRGEDVLEVRLDALDERRGEVARAEHRRAGLLGGRDQLRRRLEPLRHDEARHVRGEEPAQHVDGALARERGEVGELGVAEDLHALLVQVLGEPGEDEPGLLDARRRDAAREPLLARHEREPKVELLVVEQGPDADGVHRVRSLTR